jgi:hypothetical protein
MGTRHATRGTHFADLVAGFDVSAWRDVDLAQMAVQGHETLTMIDEHRFSVEKEIARLDDLSRCGRKDRRTDGRCDIHPRVRITRLIIEHATQTE